MRLLEETEARLITATSDPHKVSIEVSRAQSMLQTVSKNTVELKKQNNKES